MAHELSKRLSIVLPYLYPNLVNDRGLGDGDYSLQNDGDGTYLVWTNSEITEPTAQEIIDAKFNAMDTYWWKHLRQVRDKLLVDSDWSQGTDVPSSLKTEYATYRGKLRDLPTTVTKPAYADLIRLEVTTSGIDDLMPTKP